VVAPQESTTAISREKRGEYLIEAGACRLPAGNRWQPRLTLTRILPANVLPKMQSFPGLTPEFATARGATRFAMDLGRQMVDQNSARLRI
jgi:hypothetical protein